MELTILPADARGRVHWEALEPALRHNTRALVCCHGSNLTGNLNDLTALGEFCWGARPHLCGGRGPDREGCFPSIWRGSTSACSVWYTTRV